MNYIYSGGYKSLLFAIGMKNRGKKISIITNNNDIVKYCKTENIKCIHYNFIRLTFPSVIYKIFSLKKSLDEVIEKMDFGKKDNFYMIGSRIKGYDGFYLAKELSKIGKAYYRNPHDRQLKLYKQPRFKPIFIRGTILKFFLKQVFGLDIVYYNLNEIPCLGIDDHFLQENNIDIYAPNTSSDTIIFNTIQKSKSNIKDSDNLILDDGPLSTPNPLFGPYIIKHDTLRRAYKNLIDIPVQFAFKKHPKTTTQEHTSDLSFYDLFNSCEELPSYIPVELLFNNIKKNVISTYSSSLILASQLPHLKAISLLELITWHNESFKEEMKDWLKQKSNNKILFPKSYDELTEILLEE